MKSLEISRSKFEPFSLACTDPYIGIGWEYRSKINVTEKKIVFGPKSPVTGVWNVPLPRTLSSTICTRY